MRRKLAAGNWKMNGTRATLVELAGMAGAAEGAAEVLICPPATLLTEAAAIGGSVALGGQDCHPADAGAHTGDISAAMLKDAGASYVILGHSERRADHGETDAQVRDKTRAAWDAGLTAVVCVGETLEEREAANTLEIIGGQLAGSIPDGATAHRLVIAYEPVWAIGTGLTPTTAQIAEVHDFLRARLTDRLGEDQANTIRLLYGGSVKRSNAAEIFATSNVDGALVGGASLKSADFSSIISELEECATTD